MGHDVKEEQDKEEIRLKGASYSVVVLFSALGIFVAVNQLFNLQIGGFMPIGNAYYYYILAFFLSIVFLIYPGRESDRKIMPWYDWCLFVISIIVNIYFALNAYNILSQGWDIVAPKLAVVMSFVLWILALEGTRRTGGTILFVFSLFFSLYLVFGQYFPGIFWGAPYDWADAACYHAMSKESIIGIAMGVVGDLLIGFIIFGAVLVSSGGGQFFTDFAMSIIGDRRGGAAKIAVVSSAFMASISGSVIANVITTGTMTIPAMKRSGYKPAYAAAVEACASTGGTITPPVMGAAGFLIASFLNVPYYKVMVAAFFPAVLYYWTLILQVDLQAAKVGIGGLSKKELPQKSKVIKEGWFFIFVILMLVITLFYIRSEARAPFYSILVLLGITIFKKSTRYNLRKFIGLLFETGKLLSQITGILAGVGLIVGSLTGTGVANSFSREIVLLAGGNYFFLLILGAVTSFVLGIGMTVTACYIFLAVVLAPALIAVGLDPMACHLYVLYWGCLSYITPPVALGSITAAVIADSDPMTTGWLSMKLGAVKYIVPLYFVINPALIMSGSPGTIAVAMVTALAGCVLLASALEGRLYWHGKISAMQRVPILIAGLLLMYPSAIASLIGAATFLLFIFVVRNKTFFKQKNYC